MTKQTQARKLPLIPGSHRVDELFKALREGIPMKGLVDEMVIRRLAIARYQQEYSNCVETSFLSPLIQSELDNPANTEDIEQFGPEIAYWRVIERDAKGQNLLAEIRRYQKSVSTEMHRAMQAYIRMRNRFCVRGTSKK